jgi:hypothetical protein
MVIYPKNREIVQQRIHNLLIPISLEHNLITLIKHKKEIAIHFIKHATATAITTIVKALIN